MTVIDPRTGAIRAMVGGRDASLGPDPYAGVNLATGGVIGRQAGSAFKPFALVAALDRGIEPTAVYDAPSSLSLPLPEGGSWLVHNYDGEGAGRLTLEQATVASVNTVYAQLAAEVRPEAIVRTARAMGLQPAARGAVGGPRHERGEHPGDGVGLRDPGHAG